MDFELNALVATCHWIGQRGWCPATGGNMSVRASATDAWVTASGVDKAHVQLGDFLRVNVYTQHSDDPRPPSAETGLHTLLYRLDPNIGAVLHTHSVPATVLSMTERSAQLVLQGYEMQKALSGVRTHESTIVVPIFDNQQHIPSLAAEVEHYAAEQPLPFGFLVRGHGLYTWGADVATARRHLEAFEFLFTCELQRRQLLS